MSLGATAGLALRPCARASSVDFRLSGPASSAYDVVERVFLERERMMASEIMEGGCACRAVRYRLTSAPLFVHCCHCRWRQRETGSAFVLNALIESDRVGTLDDPDRRPPDIHIFTASKQPWVALPEGTPAMPECYRRSEHWPEASQARRKTRLGE